MAPLAYMSQYGAKRPEKAGTKNAPPESSTSEAIASVSAALLMIFRLSRSHCTAAPVIAMEPSSAYVHSPFLSP